LGQGTNLALLDAVALADSLARFDSVPQALAAYTAARKSHLHFYGDASRRLTPLFQSDLLLVPVMRDLFMWAGSRLPFAGPLALETLVGARRSWLSREDRPPQGAPETRTGYVPA
jgi:2-polyprenyl-6-methoxyphenol hydroxylase-like FAD-dependent oxidoreductase